MRNKIDCIHFVTGDILNPSTEYPLPYATVIPVNCEGVMGAGLAKQFATKYPHLFNEYKAQCEDKRIRIGNIGCSCDNGRWFVYFPTKDHWREDASIEAVIMGMESWHNELYFGSMCPMPTLFPKLACGLGPVAMVTAAEATETFQRKA